MTDERWQRVADLYDRAQNQAPSQRLLFVREASAGDSDLRRQVESLLAEDHTALVLDAPILIGAGEILDNPPVQPGTLIGPYRIDTLLGVGGMGEVYRARDTKLNRDVAIKILPPAFASDPDRLARFKREAQVLASINHPNIAAIYGFEDSGPVHALILELVDGPTLADRLDEAQSRKPKAESRRGLPVDEALAIARQIADALGAAHEQGIIHRDLKPANIKVRDDGTVKVLDFGLAKIAESQVPSPQSPVVSQSPTITTPAMTQAGMILGTAAYMSPEQAKGKPADKRSDIWAFGCVLYEMLTGKRAFDGEDVSDTLANILKADPDWHSLPQTTTASIRRLLRRALEKDRRRRLSDMVDARLELDEREDVGIAAPAPGGGAGRTVKVAWSAAALVAMASIGAAILIGRRSAAPELMRVELSTPPTSRPESIAISPDGRTVAFEGETDGRPQIWIRPLNAERAHPLAGTDQVTYIFWSPDNRSLGFFAEGKLKRIDLDSGTVRTLAPAPRGFGGTWNREGTILFNSQAGPIMAVPAAGGDVKTVVSIETLGIIGGYRAPVFLPDGHHFLFYAVGAKQRVYLDDLNGGPPTALTDADGAAAYVPGHLLLVRQGVLFAQPFNPDRLTLTGSPIVIAGENIPTTPANFAAFSASESGVIIYRSGQKERPRQFTWVNRSGVVQETVGEVTALGALNPDLSRDGHRIAFNQTKDNNTDLWVQPTSGGPASRFTSDPGLDEYPLWSPDESSIVFSSIRRGGFNLYEKSAAVDSSPETLLLSSLPRAKIATDWSPDGRFILFRYLNFDSGYDIWALPMQGDRSPFPVLQTVADERDGVFSPDGKWIAYESDQSGRPEIYITAFPKPARTFGPLSAAGGTQPRWRADGKELFYISSDRHLMAVPVHIDAAAGTVDYQAATALFVAHIPTVPSRQQYVVAPDGQRFLLNLFVDQDAGYPITMILNWKGASTQ